MEAEGGEAQREMPVSEGSRRIEEIRAALPRGGVFAEKEWRFSPEPFPLSPDEVALLRRLGPALQRFQQVCDNLYRRSVKGSLPDWIARYVDEGKPSSVVALGRAAGHREVFPHVIRPDLILTEDGFVLTEIDSVPGGIGLTAWLNQVYARWDTDGALVGGASAMIEGFHRILPDSGNILVSEESRDYRPEMVWLARQLNERYGKTGTWHTLRAENFPFRDKAVYRFFELFDLPNIPGAQDLARHAATGQLIVTPPFKAYLEEKLWLALFHLAPLRRIWIRELRESNFRFLAQVIPYGWMVDPAPLPHHAVLPRLEIHEWDELKLFSQSQRELVLKRSGFSELAWGSRSVRIGSDLSQRDWAQAVERALCDFPAQPWIMQEFHRGRLVEHPYWDEDAGEMRMLSGRVRLCPYYMPGVDREMKLCGVLATICPADKKVLHGMREAILVPCCESRNAGG